MPFAADLARNVLDGALLGPTFPLRHLSQMLGRPFHTAHIRHAGKVTFRPKSSDPEVFADIFRRKAYDFSWLQQYRRVIERYERILANGRVPMIVDAGANVGAASIWFATTFPGSRILAVEPDPDNLAVLRMNARDRADIEIVAAAIGSEPGAVTLKNPDNMAWSVQTERDASGDVPVMTIADVMARHGGGNPLFLVKVDIEGFESDLFAKNLDWLDETEVLIIEPHDWLHPGARTSRSFQAAMLERDFEMIISGENLIYLRL